MTFDQYIDNPMGKANAVFAARHSYKVEYSQKFDALYMREAGKIDRTLYYDKGNDEYYAHIKIPSETLEHLYYDVVIKFYSDDNAMKTAGDLKNYQVQFFSNDPAFIYTYLYVFNKHNMLIQELKSKCPRASLTMNPSERNAYEVPGYVKSIYFAYLLMSRTDMFLKSTYHNFGRRYSKSALLSQVSSGEQKMDERHRVEAKAKAAKKNEKLNKERITSQRTVPNTATSHVRTVKHSGVSNAIKQVNRVNPIKPKSKIGKKKSK